MYLPCLPLVDELDFVCICPLLIGLIVILSTFFSHGEYGFTSVEVVAI